MTSQRGRLTPRAPSSQYEAKSTATQSQNLSVFEMAPRGQRYLHQKRSMKRPPSRARPRVQIDIHRVISPLKPVATA